MLKALLVATVSQQFTLFEKDNIRLLQELDCEVHCAANFEDATQELDQFDIVRHPIDIQRSPFSFKNIKALFQLKRLMEVEKFNVIHCHAPMGGVLGRLCAGLTGTCPVIYTAHGFHFYRGAPLKNWMLYYPVERWLARKTDALITINKEDFLRAKGFKLRHKNGVYRIPGVGIDSERFKPVSEEQRLELRKKYGFQPDDFLLVFPGWLNKNKNQTLLIKMMAVLKEEIPKVKLLLPGRGDYKKRYMDFTERLGLDKNVLFPGYMKNMDEWYKMSDISISSSLREGLPMNIAEGMACGRPVVATNIRGHNELVEDGGNGYLLGTKDVIGFAGAIERIFYSGRLMKEMSAKSIEKSKRFSLEASRNKMKEIYRKYLQLEYIPLVSIVIPVYNGSNYIKEAINSALDQTYKNIEIIVINDGSNDDGATERAILDEFEGKVRYYSKPNGGVSSALNYAIRHMRGEWFSWLSHDDLYEPTKIEKQIIYLNKVLEETPEADISRTAVICYSDCIDGNGKYLIKFNQRQNLKKSPQDIIISNIRKNRLLGCTFLIHSKTFSEVGFFNESYRTVQDAEYWYRMFFKGYSFKCIPEVLVHTRVHPSQVTFRLSDTMANEISRLHDWLCEKFISENRFMKNGLFFKLVSALIGKGLTLQAKFIFKHIKKMNPLLYYLVSVPIWVIYLLKYQTKKILKVIYLRIKLK